MNEIPNFSSLVDKKVLDGDKVRIDDLLNKEIIICNYNEQGVASIKGWLRWCCSYNLRKSLNML